MKDWHKHLIPIKKALENPPKIPAQRIFSEIMSGTLTLYYLIPPGRFASERPTETYQLVTDDGDGTTLVVWGGSHEISGPDALPVFNPQGLLETALYTQFAEGEGNILETAIDRKKITLIDNDKLLVPARWPLASLTLGEVELSPHVLGDMFKRQHPDHTEPFLYREFDDDPLSIGDFLIPKEFLESLAGAQPHVEAMTAKEGSVGPRERNSLLNIIWVLLQLAINKSRNLNANQAMIRGELLELNKQLGNLQGVSKAKLDAIFAEANKLNKDRKRNTKGR